MSKRSRVISLSDWTFEHDIQVSVIQWSLFARNQFPDLDMLYAIPNGGDRDVRVGMKLKAEGVRRGVPDLHLPVPRGVHPSLYIEIKTKKGQLSSDQRWWMERLLLTGHAWVLCRTLDEAIDSFTAYLSLGLGESMSDTDRIERIKV